MKQNLKHVWQKKTYEVLRVRREKTENLKCHVLSNMANTLGMLIEYPYSKSVTVTDLRNLGCPRARCWGNIWEAATKIILIGRM
jgi:hypothetical protein